MNQPMNRRQALTAIAGGAFAVRTGVTAQLNDDPFTLGVASGDPLPDGVVLWTRLALKPLEGGGMRPEPVSVNWRVASDERMSNIVKKGTIVARPESAHCVHVDVRGLEPSRWYWYQFDVPARSARMESPIGRTKTAPRIDSQPRGLRFAFASCQKYEDGYFNAYQHMAEEDLDLVIHLGDYIYEGAGRPGRVRMHPPEQAMNLEQYRLRYAVYKSDADLQKAHQLFPWAVVWDDHEVSDNYATLIPDLDSPRDTFPQRRAAAYQAYFEHMPLRAAAQPRGWDMQLFRRLQFGNLATFHMLDTRQYRSDQPCGDREKPSCEDRINPASTMLGSTQERWLKEGLSGSRAVWNVMAQQIIFSQWDLQPGSGEIFAMDKWDGYPAARERLIEFFSERKPSNPIVISGDNHNNWVFDVKRDFSNEKSAVVATEFVGTSISSAGDGAERSPDAGKAVESNPHLKFHNSQRGYVRCVVSPNNWQSDFRIVPFVSRRGAPIETKASFVVENGRPGALRA
jgi:alkaline phosphatase D